MHDKQIAYIQRAARVCAPVAAAEQRAEASGDDRDHRRTGSARDSEAGDELNAPMLSVTPSPGMQVRSDMVADPEVGVGIAPIPRCVEDSGDRQQIHERGAASTARAPVVRSRQISSQPSAPSADAATRVAAPTSHRRLGLGQLRRATVARLQQRATSPVTARTASAVIERGSRDGLDVRTAESPRLQGSNSSRSAVRAFCPSEAIATSTLAGGARRVSRRVAATPATCVDVYARAPASRRFDSEAVASLHRRLRASPSQSPSDRDRDLELRLARRRRQPPG